MYCKHCGKEISDEAIACPGCGHPTKAEHSARKEKILSARDPRLSNPSVIAGFVLSAIAFVAGVILLSLSIAGNYESILYYSVLILLPAVIGLTLDIYGLSRAHIFGTQAQKGLAIAGIVLAGIVLLYFFVVCCIIAHTEEYYYILG